MTRTEPRVCPACEVGECLPAEDDAPFTYKGINVRVHVRFHRCSNCGEETVFSDFAQAFEMAYENAKRRIDADAKP